MRILDKYIGITVISYTIASLLVLIVLQLAFAFVDEMGDVGKGVYSSGMAVNYILLTIPGRIYEMFPVSALLGSLLGLGGLAGNSELTVIRSSGISIYRISRSVLQAGLVLMAISFVIGEWISPPLQEIAQTYRANAIANRVSVTNTGGFRVRDGRQMINVGKTISKNLIQDITIENLKLDKSVESIIQANEAIYKDGKWSLMGLTITSFNKNIAVDYKSELAWDVELVPETLDVISSEPENLSVVELKDYIAYQEANGLDTKRYKLAFWNKIVSPFSTLVMLLVAIPFVFGSLRSVGMGQRLMIGILIGIGFFLLNRIIGTSALIYGINEFVCASAPTFLFLILGVIGIKRVS